MLRRTVDEAHIISPEDYKYYGEYCEECPEDIRFWEVEIFDEDDDTYWDSISWPTRYVSDLDGNRPIFKSSDWYYRPKHRRAWRPGQPAKHWLGESRRRQHYKNEKKSHLRMATRDAIKGSPKQLMSGRICTSWDIN